jgi:hypothetical protein
MESIFKPSFECTPVIRPLITTGSTSANAKVPERTHVFEGYTMLERRSFKPGHHSSYPK